MSAKKQNPVMTPDEAFISSEGYMFEGIKLEPWTVPRQIAAIQMGLDFKNALTAIYVLWLCAQPTERVRMVRHNVAGAIVDAEEWAQKLGVNLFSKKFERASQLFAQICAELSASESQPQERHTGRADDEPGEL